MAVNQILNLSLQIIFCNKNKNPYSIQLLLRERAIQRFNENFDANRCQSVFEKFDFYITNIIREKLQNNLM